MDSVKASHLRHISKPELDSYVSRFSCVLGTDRAHPVKIGFAVRVTRRRCARVVSLRHGDAQ